MKKIKITPIMIAGIVFLSMFILIGCGSKKGSDQKSSAGKVLPKLVDFGAENCIPCKKMAPLLEDLRVEYEGVMDVVFIDVRKEENKQQALKYGIKTIPTQIFYDSDENELWRHVGFISKEDILKKWKELGFDLMPADIPSDKACCPGADLQTELRTCE